jgi:hypothetical protein
MVAQHSHVTDAYYLSRDGVGPPSITRTGYTLLSREAQAMMDESGFKVSRRTVLRVGVGVLAALIPVRASAQPKIAQKLVQYQEKPKGPQECDNCLHFVPPSSCKMVEGKINPKGWCQLYAPKPK